MKYNALNKDTIAALATPHGMGAIAVIRVSGADAFNICNNFFYTQKLQGVDINSFDSHTLHFGAIKKDDIVIDQVLLSVFKAPHSFTGENSVEISCHGSLFIQQQILSLLHANGARAAEAGEFTFRAFVNGKMDLSQAEAVADIIASNSATSHQVAMMHLRGGFSEKIKVLRENLLNFASLIELELDFSEEDVEFANRDDLRKLIITIQKIVTRLIDSFELGNVIKNGIPVAIVGKPNAGKSTLLNVLLEEDRAIVSEIPGTTRDAIEDEIAIDGVMFRFIDTAGIRSTTDIIEAIGVQKTFEKISSSSIVIYLFDINELSSNELKQVIDEINKHKKNAQLIIVANKFDKADVEYTKKEFVEFKDILYLSAKEHLNIDQLKQRLVHLFDSRTVNIPETVVTNARHVDSLRHANSSLNKVIDGLNTGAPSELLAADVKIALHHLGEITGEISNDNLLQNIFTKFCIGK